MQVLEPPRKRTRFKPVTESDVQHATNRVNINTLKAEVQWVKVFEEWLKETNQPKSVAEITKTEFIELLSPFILALRKQDGEEYAPSTVKTGIMALVRAYGRQHNVQPFPNFLKDPDFSKPRSVLDDYIRSRQVKGNYKSNKAPGFTREQIHLLLKCPCHSTRYSNWPDSTYFPSYCSLHWDASKWPLQPSSE
jgi:hypothetical protein